MKMTMTQCMLGDGQQQLGHLHGCIRWRSLCPAREEDKTEVSFSCGSAGARLKLNKKGETRKTPLCPVNMERGG